MSVTQQSCYVRDGLETSVGCCVLGGVGVSLVGVDSGESSTGSRALPGTGFHTPSDSHPRTKDVHGSDGL